MATEFLYFKGKAKWAQLTKPDKEYDNFKINLYLDDNSKSLFAESGLQLEPKTDEDGEFVVFRRPNYKQIKKELVHFGAPEVVDAEGTPTNALIGNGSEVAIKVVVYDSKKGKGHRLESVKILNLVPYEGSGGQASVRTAEGVNAW
jgi:hypothetical protein